MKPRLGVTVYLLTLSVFSLVGCTPGPVSEVSQRPIVEEGQSIGKNIVFATSKLSITSPPIVWKRIKVKTTVISFRTKTKKLAYHLADRGTSLETWEKHASTSSSVSTT